MTPQEHVDFLIKKYAGEVLDLNQEIGDLEVPVRQRERDWAKRILLVDILANLTVLRDEIHERENYES